MIPPLDIAESLSGGGLVFRFGVGQLFGTCDDVQCRYVSTSIGKTSGYASASRESQGGVREPGA